MNTAKLIIPKLIELLTQERFPIGTHLAAQKIADRLNVSRSPVNDALQSLCETGLLIRLPNRGYFLAQDPACYNVSVETPESDVLGQTYFALADDLLTGRLPMTASEVALKARYHLTGAQLQTLLTRISKEGWVSRKPGYGWEFSSMMTTPDSLLQSYRMRLALEPAALLEPGYHLDKAIIERCRAVELDLINGGINSASADQLHDRGVRFHEALVEASGNSFFIDTIKRVNKVRRLLSYRSMKNRTRYVEHCEQHLAILSLLERNETQLASIALRDHLQSTVRNLSEINDILRPENV
ncbi:GntR family transcriptional regulator [Pseudomonas viridiflava]|uniref:GntR family transcriptional regulator n=1 Tax=Pseudomonas viridiflava TaxID=33069 RepID=A0ABU7N0S0_PSEVI|nr:GntR family transcriptional regulator [Pseudomonas viridiflava]MCJ8176645.1 GntR family transcriptional regulator [Pseudomonas viridiflava]MEE3934220.1 GntR family transcriptional regulator [Pseudomonas viridiflava]MEE4038523.1 GntR family transcriptional regulator [Pseudomonas viridiflava]MEE4058505.1 GntR family transcriptional regulator [Pseudomonas viridiflava]MEE4167576.1 GntR family transcriptional regulator [Pseudomonas viridiflava]